jgi:hypothetical protein
VRFLLRRLYFVLSAMMRDGLAIGLRILMIKRFFIDKVDQP